ncbi:MAG: hypothetical protein QXE92_00125 [Thermofilaceae archaeon]
MPRDAVEDADIVKVLVNVGVPLDGLKEKLSPLPPLALSETEGLLAAFTVKPYVAVFDRPPPLPVTVTLYVPAGVPLEASLTETVTDLLAPLHSESEPLLKLMEKSNVKEVVIVIVDVADGLLGLTVTLLGLKLAEAPLGRPEAERLTVMDELYPPVRLTVTVAETLPPAVTDPLDGLTLTVNV